MSLDPDPSSVSRGKPPAHAWVALKPLIIGVCFSDSGQEGDSFHIQLCFFNIIALLSLKTCIYLSVSGLSRSMQDLHCIPQDLSWRHTDPPVVASGLSSCGV